MPAMERLEAGCELTGLARGLADARERFLVEAAGKTGLLTLLTERVDEELLEAAGGQLVVVSNYAVGWTTLTWAAARGGASS